MIKRTTTIILDGTPDVVPTVTYPAGEAMVTLHFRDLRLVLPIKLAEYLVDELPGAVREAKDDAHSCGRDDCAKCGDPYSNA